MKLIHQLLLRRLPGPFVGWLATLLFLLFLQFLIKFLPDLAGRGLPLSLIIELIIYNLAYMVVLAVPMATLLSSLMAFGSLAESRTWVVIRNSGIPLWRLMWPVMVVAGLLMCGMGYFNNVMLPESNFRARNIWQDVRKKRPGFDLQPGIFYEGLSNYSIMVRHRVDNDLEDILVYDYSESGRGGTTIRAQRGTLQSEARTVSLLLWNGEIHQLKYTGTRDESERYERLAFERFHLRFDLSEFAFERSDPTRGYRSDRSTPTWAMMRIVDSLQVIIANKREQIRLSVPSISGQGEHESDGSVLVHVAESPSLRVPVYGHATHSDGERIIGVFDEQTDVRRLAIADLDRKQVARVYDVAQESVRSARSEAATLKSTIERDENWVRRYQVEIHKKYSIAVACLIFMFLGAPLGLSIRRGGLGTAGGLALAIFMFYWVTLVQGEKLADRDLLSPWVGMWMANIVMGLFGLGLFAYVAFDLRGRFRSRWRFGRR